MIKKRYSLAVPGTVKPKQEMKWLRGIRTGLRLALGCCLAWMLIYTCAVLWQECCVFPLAAEDVSSLRLALRIQYGTVMLWLAVLVLALSGLLLTLRVHWQAWSAALTGQRAGRITEKEDQKHENH